MKKYFHVINIGIQNTLVYRVNFFFRAMFALIPLLATIYLWRAVFGGRTAGPEIEGYTVAGMTSYYVLVTIVDALTAVTDDDWQIAADIRDGNINQFLLKPIDYLTYRLCLFFSNRVIYCVTAVVPVALFVFFMRRYFVMPPSAGVFALFIVSVIFTGLLQFFISYSLALLAFWVLEVSTFIFIVFAVEYIAGGHLFPLDILPGSLQEVLKFTPFPYQLFFPVSIYLGRVSGAELWTGLGLQTFWLVAFYGVALWAWRRGIRHYSAVGG